MGCAASTELALSSPDLHVAVSGLAGDEHFDGAVALADPDAGQGRGWDVEL